MVKDFQMLEQYCNEVDFKRKIISNDESKENTAGRIICYKFRKEGHKSFDCPNDKNKNKNTNIKS